jgi:hypothetical protein
MGRIVIACYRPKPGKKASLKRLILDHVATLAAEGLVTDRAPIIMEAQDGTVVEVFEWTSSAAIESAHINAAVLKMWEQYTEVCDHIPVAEVPEAAQMFSEFTPIEGVRHRPNPAAVGKKPPPSPPSPPARQRSRTRTRF